MWRGRTFRGRKAGAIPIGVVQAARWNGVERMQELSAERMRSGRIQTLPCAPDEFSHCVVVKSMSVGLARSGHARLDAEQRIAADRIFSQQLAAV